ncbi:helix-turn-helix domain-containing protein [Sphingomonas sp. SRS2]|uniref:helix-turn-helix domain-containing protein n=1 Tax=Sphingomonas sp. SRS2 TaxID=133190 RepID=UPI0006184E52|nr:helix-turn-helix transcriptional regulator [Sphingomonas sp. SRS2]KKC25969.1 LuxR family transcriptional regulator [Sphingomonas sp. SRS2]
MGHEAITKLTARQRDCLRLVLHHMQSKEIGRQLGISPMTVDNHFRSAIQTLGVANRLEAARLLEAYERNAAEAPSQRLTSQPQPVVSRVEAPIMSSPAVVGDRQGDGVSALREDQVPYRTFRDAGIIDFPLPVPTRGKPRNDLTIAQRLFWIAILIFGMGLGAGALLSGFATLTNILLALKR